MYLKIRNLGNENGTRLLKWKEKEMTLEPEMNPL